MHCAREDELLDALMLGYVGPELTEHVAGCASCSEVHAVSAALLGERREAVREAPVPAAAAMRHRLEMRLRRDVDAAARRSLMIGQALTLALAAALTYVFLGGTVAGVVRQAIASGSVTLSTFVIFAACAALAPLAGAAALWTRASRTR